MDFEDTRETDPSYDKLDVEYRQILRIIKPYIQTINNNAYLAQYRVWLEKLSETKENERFLRNQYLMELARQIQCKHLVDPFTKAPPRGTLVPLKGHQSNLPKDVSFSQQLDVTESVLSKQKMCEQWAEDNENNSQWPYHSGIPKPRKPHKQLLLLPVEDQHLREAQKFVQRSATSVKKISLMKEIDGQCQERYSEAKSPSKPLFSSHMQESKKKQSFIPQKSPLGAIEEDYADSESWSDASVAVLGSGDTDAKEKKKRVTEETDGDLFEKMDTFMTHINGIKMKNEKMKEEREASVKNVRDPPFGRMSSSEELRVRKFPERVLSPDEPGDSEEKLVNGKDASFLTSDWKKIIESLQVRLSETQQQNKELNSLTSTLHKKIKEMDASRVQTKQEIKKQVHEQHKKELENLKNSHEEKLKAIEEEHQRKIKEIEEHFGKEMEKMRTAYEDRNKEKEEKHSSKLKSKDKEINRLEDIIQRECTRLVSEITVLRSQIEEASNTNTSNDERILFLQKCITKMDRLFQKSEREYCKQIEKLKQELDNREKAVKIQLQTQKAEVIARCSEEKQAELDSIVENLESKYTQLLEAQQSRMTKMKEEDEDVIKNLRTILDQHNIQY